jgi:hypothetical protein
MVKLYFYLIKQHDIKVTVFWVVALYKLVENDQCFRGAYWVIAVSTCETLASFY